MGGGSSSAWTRVCRGAALSALRFFQAVGNLAATLRTGITTIRDAGGAGLGLQQAVPDGLIAGPRVRISLAMISQTGGHGDPWLPSGRLAGLLHPHPGLPCDFADLSDRIRAVCQDGRLI